ncbi:mammalian cell entry protein [Halarcobacter anaerophilus]|uniref:Mammalian cell entry protein n=1 Tax=Halarcobacter anaerophilus TaxID=877500 RepID=A0A4Q0Y5E6_9BACT|nr:mammalian cell entry protein [Halarcobacter anaerophilus]
MFIFSYWLLKPKQENETKKYLIRFDESVLGLNIDSAVKYRGIDVGKVSNIRINPKNTEQVEVLITILKTTPIKEKTVAKLTSQGITGLSYINLNLGDNNAPFLKTKKGEEYPIIKTVPSLFENIEKSMSTISDKVSKVLSKTEHLLDDKNQKQISLILKETTIFMTRMGKLLDDKSIKHFHHILENLDNITKKTDKLIPKIDNLMTNTTNFEKSLIKDADSIAKSFIALRAAMNELQKAIANGDFNFKEMTKDTIPTLNSTLIQMENLMIKMEESLKDYNRSPADIIFKTEEIKKGPGE